MIYANNTHFQKKSDALGLILKVRAFGTQKLPITVCFARVCTHANIKVFSHAERHEHSFILATGIKSRTDLAQTTGKDRRNRDQVDSRVCASTLLRTAYISSLCLLIFNQMTKKMHSTRCLAQLKSGSLVGYRVQRNVFSS